MAGFTSVRSDRSRLGVLNPWTMVRSLWRQRSLIFQLTKREIEGRYRGSFLGLFWSLAQPLFMLLIYTLVFGVIFKSRWPRAGTTNLNEFALIVFCGLVAFGLFSECVTRAPNSVISVPNYVKKVVFPLEVLPVSIFGTALFHTCVSITVLLVAQLLVAGFVSWTAILLPLVLIPAIFLSLGLMWLLASLGVFVRDIGQVVGIVVQALFFLTPIFYSIDALPPELRWLILSNPLAAVVENFRRVVLWGELPNFAELLGWILATGSFMMIGYAWFMQTKKAFADVI